MASTGTTGQDAQGETYIATARLLIDQIAHAVEAITRNQIEELEESVADQRALAVSLRNMRNEWHRDINGRPMVDEDGSKEKLYLKLLAVEDELRVSNRVYGCLVERCSHSASLMGSLIDSSTGKFQGASGSRLKYQTWSCRM